MTWTQHSKTKKTKKDDGGREETRAQIQKGVKERRDTGDLLLSGDLMREVEEDRRLLMQASGCGVRFVVDVERLSNIEGRRTNRQGRKGLHGRWAEGTGIEVWVQTQYTRYDCGGEEIYSDNLIEHTGQTPEKKTH